MRFQQGVPFFNTLVLGEETQETRKIAVSYGVERLTDCYFVLSQSTRLTDGQTDRQTDVDSKSVRMHSESHGKNTQHVVLENDKMMLFQPRQPPFSCVSVMQN